MTQVQLVRSLVEVVRSIVRVSAPLGGACLDLSIENVIVQTLPLQFRAAPTLFE